MEKEPRTASLLHILVTWLTFFTFMMLQRWVSRLLFLKLMKPLVPISCLQRSPRGQSSSGFDRSVFPKSNQQRNIV